MANRTTKRPEDETQVHSSPSADAELLELSVSPSKRKTAKASATSGPRADSPSGHKKRSAKDSPPISLPSPAPSEEGEPPITSPKKKKVRSTSGDDTPEAKAGALRRDEEAIDDIEFADFKFELEDDSEGAKENIFTEGCKGFAEYLDTTKFYDVLLTLPNGTEYRCHKLILANSSFWFLELFTKGTAPVSHYSDDETASNSSVSSLENLRLGEPSSGRSEISVELPDFSTATLTSGHGAVGIGTVKLPWYDEGQVLPSVIRWMYTGVIQLTPQNCVMLSVTAERYQINLLQKICKEYISANLQGENATDMLNEAMKVGAHSLVKKSISIVANSFSRIKNHTSFVKLHYEVFIRILQHRRLHITEEYLLYKVCCEYIEAHKFNLSVEQTYNLMQNVRYRWLSFEQLEEASKNPAIPRPLLIEAAIARLTGFECTPEEIEKRAAALPPRLQPRPKSSLSFEFNKDDAEFFHGIVGWIATNGGREPWKNPHMAGRVKVHSSSLAKGSRATLVDKTPAEVWSNDVPSSWFSIDFGPHRRVTPTYYTLRHGGKFKGDALRTWDLQASNDGVSWKPIKRNSNEKSLSTPLAACSWPVPGVVESFRFFRILQTSHNSSGHNYLCLSGFEFFGVLDASL